MQGISKLAKVGAHGEVIDGVSGEVVDGAREEVFDGAREEVFDGVHKGCLWAPTGKQDRDNSQGLPLAWEFASRMVPICTSRECGQG